MIAAFLVHVRDEGLEGVVHIALVQRRSLKEADRLLLF